MPPTTRQHLADALDRAHSVAQKGIVRSTDIRRADRTNLQQHGYLSSIIKGWYFLSSPSTRSGESTAWYASFWDFISIYLGTRFGQRYHLSAVNSLDVHLCTNTIPHQIIAVSSQGGKTLLNLPHDTSLLTYESPHNFFNHAVEVNGLQVMPLDMALCCAPTIFFQQNPALAEIALRTLPSFTDLLRRLLSDAKISAAQRLAGAYESIGLPHNASEIVRSMQAAGHKCTPENPFTTAPPPQLSLDPAISPQTAKIATLFSSMHSVTKNESSLLMSNKQPEKTALQHIDDAYEQDAYHSLSIEGYQVTPELIHRIRSGEWNPDHNPEDQQERNALAAKGYLDAFQAVKKTVATLLNGAPPIETILQQYGQWYTALFAPSVQAGILEPQHLAGFRNTRVFICGSRHIPPAPQTLKDSMQMFFDQLKAHEDPATRAILGHFIFTYIHPYMDGNGRMARFLMNAILTSAGLPWTIIRVTRRVEYMQALEAASCKGDIKPFTRFINEESNISWHR